MKGLLERFAEFFFSAPGTPFPSANEVLPGVPKPSSILAGMIAAEILKAPENIGENQFTHEKFSVIFTKTRALIDVGNITQADIDEAIRDYWGSDEKVRQWRKEYSYRGGCFSRTVAYVKQRDGDKQPYVAHVTRVLYIDCTFDAAEKKVIADAITEGLRLKAELEKNKAFHDNQHKAVAAIEALAPRPKPEEKEEEKCTEKPRVTTGSTKTTRKKPVVAASCSCPGTSSKVCLCPL